MDIDESDLHLQTEETDGYMFATVDEIKAFAAEGKFLHYDSIKRRLNKNFGVKSHKII